MLWSMQLLANKKIQTFWFLKKVNASKYDVSYNTALFISEQQQGMHNKK